MQVIASLRCDFSIDSGHALAKNSGTTLACISGRARHPSLRPTACRYGQWSDGPSAPQELHSVIYLEFLGLRWS